jgi:long-chain acyl-CoA synthetase
MSAVMAAPPGSVAALLTAQAAAAGSRTALVDGSLRLSFAELDAAVTRAAQALLGARLRPGDRVVLQLAGADLVVLYLGASRAGVVAVPVNPAFTARELAHVVGDSGADLLISSGTPEADIPVVAADQLADFLSRAPDAELPDRSPEDLAVLLYTSGTTGLPRGAMLTSRALLANLDQIAALEPPAITDADVVFVPVPLFHIFGLNGGLGVALHQGATLVLSDRFEAGPTLATMTIEAVTAVAGVPSMFSAWLDEPGFEDAFRTVRFAWSGSAAMPRRIVRAYAERGVQLYEGYGLTETAPVVALNWSANGPIPGFVGRAAPGVEIELRDADGEPPRRRDPAQIFVRGPNLFSGYWPDGAGGPDADGWFATGDLATVDDDGNLRLVGRTSDLVIVNGFNVYPAEVEAVLRSIEGVAEAAVIGVADDATGEAIIAYVVPEPGAHLDAEQIVTAASAGLARFKLPRRVELVAELPHTVTGKVMKWRLRDRGADAGD